MKHWVDLLAPGIFCLLGLGMGYLVAYSRPVPEPERAVDRWNTSIDCIPSSNHIPDQATNHLANEMRAFARAEVVRALGDVADNMRSCHDGSAELWARLLPGEEE